MAHPMTRALSPEDGAVEGPDVIQISSLFGPARRKEVARRRHVLRGRDLQFSLDLDRDVEGQGGHADGATGVAADLGAIEVE